MGEQQRGNKVLVTVRWYCFRSFLVVFRLGFQFISDNFFTYFHVCIPYGMLEDGDESLVKGYIVEDV
jgi:flagellar motor switch protein FliM